MVYLWIGVINETDNLVIIHFIKNKMTHKYLYILSYLLKMNNICKRYTTSPTYRIIFALSWCGLSNIKSPSSMKNSICKGYGVLLQIGLCNLWRLQIKCMSMFQFPTNRNIRLPWIFFFFYLIFNYFKPTVYLFIILYAWKYDSAIFFLVISCQWKKILPNEYVQNCLNQMEVLHT